MCASVCQQNFVYNRMFQTRFDIRDVVDWTWLKEMWKTENFEI